MTSIMNTNAKEKNFALREKRSLTEDFSPHYTHLATFHVYGRSLISPCILLYCFLLDCFPEINLLTVEAFGSLKCLWGMGDKGCVGNSN